MQKCLFLVSCINRGYGRISHRNSLSGGKHEKILCRHDGSRCRAINGRF